MSQMEITLSLTWWQVFWVYFVLSYVIIIVGTRLAVQSKEYITREDRGFLLFGILFSPLSLPVYILTFVILSLCWFFWWLVSAGTDHKEES